MSAVALIVGALFKAPEVKTSKAGKPYATATLKVVVGSDAAEFWQLLVFPEAAQSEVMRLRAGDKLSAQGRFTCEPYVARDGATKISRTLFADAVLPLRAAPRERRSNSATDAPPPSNDEGPNDEIPL